MQKSVDKLCCKILLKNTKSAAEIYRKLLQKSAIKCCWNLHKNFIGLLQKNEKISAEICLKNAAEYCGKYAEICLRCAYFLLKSALKMLLNFTENKQKIFLKCAYFLLKSALKMLQNIAENKQKCLIFKRDYGRYGLSLFTIKNMFLNYLNYLKTSNMAY